MIKEERQLQNNVERLENEKRQLEIISTDMKNETQKIMQLLDNLKMSEENLKSEVFDKESSKAKISSR